MRLTDRDPRTECAIIPFQRPHQDTDSITTSNIAAVIAVTVLHDCDMSPEEKLISIIEASGEAEILDNIDGMESFSEFDQPFDVAINDNERMTLV
ncbi:hypothetical protein N9X12_08905 [Alphaproteobacteria bacterium]|jgi:uncharacterized protein YcfJ|nr:hypothetical protein [Alphaproteobacteria bacterium]